MDDVFDIAPLVRRFSEKVNINGSENVAARGLLAHVEHKQSVEQAAKEEPLAYRKWVNTTEDVEDPFEAELQKHKEQMIADWKRTGFGKPWTDEANGGVPTIDYLGSVVDDAQKTWKTNKSHGFHLVFDRFRSFAKNLSRYNQLAAVIPSGDKYVCLITGVVSSLIKVSSNYNDAVEAFSDGIAGLHSTIRNMDDDAKVVRTNKMRELVCKLLVEIFSFLCQAIRWYTKRGTRFKMALSSNDVKSVVKDSVAKIEAIETSIRHEAERSNREINRGTAAKVDEIYTAIYDFKDKFERSSLQRNVTLETLNSLNISDEVLVQFVGQNMFIVMQAVAEQQSYHEALRAITHPTEVASNKVGADFSTANKATRGYQDSTNDAKQITAQEQSMDIEDSVSSTSRDELTINRYDLDRMVLHLKRYIEDDRDDIFFAQGQLPPARLPERAVVSLRDWTTAKVTRFDWLEGPANVELSGTTVAAMQLCDIALSMGLRCISYFCPMKHPTTGTKGLTRNQAGLVAMLYSLIFQLVQSLPSELEAGSLPSEDKFAKLDGTFSSAKTALEVIESLGQQIQGMIHWIIGGLAFIEDRQTTPHIIKLVEILRRQGERTVCKVCFVTDGSSLALNKTMKIAEITDATRVYSSSSAGGVSMTDLSNYM